MLQGIPIVKEALAYNKILRYFAMASDMEVNLSKSKIFFLILTLLYREIFPEFWTFKGIFSLQNVWEFLYWPNIYTRTSESQ